jgi:hypothetical protein
MKQLPGSFASIILPERQDSVSDHDSQYTEVGKVWRRIFSALRDAAIRRERGADHHRREGTYRNQRRALSGMWTEIKLR